MRCCMARLWRAITARWSCCSFRPLPPPFVQRLILPALARLGVRRVYRAEHFAELEARGGKKRALIGKRLESPNLCPATPSDCRIDVGRSGRGWPPFPERGLAIRPGRQRSSAQRRRSGTWRVDGSGDGQLAGCLGVDLEAPACTTAAVNQLCPSIGEADAPAVGASASLSVVKAAMRL